MRNEEYITHTEEYRGYTLDIVQDNHPESPREWGSSATTMVCWHSRYTLGDEQPKCSPEEWLEELAGIDTEVDDYQFSREDCYRMIEEKGIMIMPLGLYDHSGITMYIGSRHWQDGAGWDSGQVGWVYMTKETIEKEGWTKEQAENYMEGEVETYDDYLTGNVWGWRISNEEDDNIESCFGYYGDAGEKDAIAEAKSSIDWLCEKAQEKYEKEPKKLAAEHYMV